MKTVLLVGESYSGGVKTYIDTIMSNRQFLPSVDFQALVSSKRLENTDGFGEGYFVEDSLSFGKSPWKFLKALVELHRVVREEGIDVIHANSTFAGVLMYFYSRLNRKLFYIYTPHGYYSFKNMGKAKKNAVRLIEKKINKAAHMVIHVSPSEEKEAIENKLVPRDKSVVVLNGVKDPGTAGNRRDGTPFTIVNLARVDDQKNPFEFIEIARKVVGRSPDVQFIWAGGGKYLEEARAQVKAYGLEERIKFIGFSLEKDRILQQSDLYFSTSHYEGLPFAVVEAMSYKLPLLLSDIIGHADLVEGQKNGLLFRENEDGAILEFIQALIENKEKWRALSAGSYHVFSERFNIQQMLKKLSEVYEVV